MLLRGHSCAAQAYKAHKPSNTLGAIKGVKEHFLSIGRVGTRDNASDIGTKHVTRERMLYLVFLCKIYDLPSSNFVGPEMDENMKQQDMMNKVSKPSQKLEFPHETQNA